MSRRYPSARWPHPSAWPSRTETGERFAACHCAAYPSANGRWSGRTTLVPSGRTIGTGATGASARYGSDLDASGAVDANVEHPTSCANVDASLANQNFLVIKGSEAPAPAARRRSLPATMPLCTST